MSMPKIKVGHYKNTGGTASAPPIGAEWAGWIEPADKSWILFIDVNGMPVFFPKRDKDGGVIVEPKRSPEVAGRLQQIESRLLDIDSEEEWHVRDRSEYDDRYIVQVDENGLANPFHMVCEIRSDGDDVEQEVTESLAHLIANAPADLRFLLALARA